MGLVVATLFGLSSTEAIAGPDAGAKARGEFKGFWEQGTSRSVNRSLSYEPTRRDADGYRSFSYEPIGVKAGDRMVVKGDDVKMMRGAKVVGDVPGGLEFKVTKVVDGWLGAVVEVDSQKLNGWIWHANAKLEEKAASAAPQTSARADSGQRNVRRFSYEPAPRTYRSYGGSKEPWQYLKTDPRRYSR
jgi:hypothetical protein